MIKMKTIGLVGGMGWESTLEYYKIINQLVKEKLDKHHSAKLILWSFDFEEIVSLMKKRDWETITKKVIDAAKKLEESGAELLLICTNTIHKIADEVKRSINIPLIHIVDTTAERIKQVGLKKVGLLGTKFTMKEEFYKKRLEEKYGISVIVPNRDEMEFIDKVIFEELCLGIINENSKQKMKKIIDNLVSKGAEGVVLGCTELPLLIKREDVNIPIFNTTLIHAEFAVKYSLEK